MSATAPSPPARAPSNPFHLGDRVKVERRYIVDGVLTAVTDEGDFQGVQLLGTSQLLQLEVVEEGAHEVRLIPLDSIAEITVLESRHVEPDDTFDPNVL